MILKSPEDPNGSARKLIFTSAARVAWRHLLLALNITAPHGVLLPSYIGFTEREGSGVFDPIEETKTPFRFYPVNDKLALDLEKFESILEQGTVKLALVIHYFGFCQNDMNRIVAMCKKYKILLVEDCAHAFQLGLENQRLGKIGDFSFYSTHKYLATKSGGVLAVNNPAFEIADVCEDYKPSLSVLEQHIKTDIQAVAQIRRDNFKLYESLLKGIPDLEVMYALSADEVPHNFPIKIKNGRREKLYFYLMEKEIPTIALYYRLIDEIKKDEYPTSFIVSDEILNLPLHQDTKVKDVVHICESVREFLLKIEK